MDFTLDNMNFTLDSMDFTYFIYLMLHKYCQQMIHMTEILIKPCLGFNNCSELRSFCQLIVN